MVLQKEKRTIFYEKQRHYTVCKGKQRTEGPFGVLSISGSALFIPGGALFILRGCLIHPHPALIIPRVWLNWSLGMNRSLYLSG